MYSMVTTQQTIVENVGDSGKTIMIHYLSLASMCKGETNCESHEKCYKQ